jgi:hypothetical protein
MVGASQNIALANIVLNTTVANSLTEFATKLEGAENLDIELDKIIKETFKKHRRIIFSGDCYSKDWEIEAERRELYAELKNILESDNFVENLFDKYEWVKIVESDTSKEIRLMLGAPLWFINYISFSNDNRYVGITGKYRDSSGVYFLFDLISEELVYKHIDDCSTGRILAVWSCAFTQNRIAGYYTSSPHCYLIDISATEIQPKRVSNKSFLCFSPSGEYMALSNKGYIPYNNYSDQNCPDTPLSDNQASKWDNQYRLHRSRACICRRFPACSYQQRNDRSRLESQVLRVLRVH